jgi:PncC family amidohydrolase
MNEAQLISLATQTAQKLIKENKTLSVAESCTGGWLSKILTDVSGISAIYKGGVCSYSNDIKTKILGVKEETLSSFGAVSEQTARQMATGVRESFGSDIGIGITGIAGPLSDNTSKPVGLIYIALSTEKETIVKELQNSFTEDIRLNNRLSALETALNLLNTTI